MGPGDIHLLQMEWVIWNTDMDDAGAHQGPEGPGPDGPPNGPMPGDMPADILHQMTIQMTVVRYVKAYTSIIN